jgi:hypothetical protein
LKSDANVVKTTNLDSSSNGKVCTFGLLHEHQSLKSLVVFDMVASTQFCEGCALGKHHKTSCKIDIMKERFQILGLFFHGDICSFMQEDSFGGTCYILCYVQR